MSGLLQGAVRTARDEAAAVELLLDRGMEASAVRAFKKAVRLSRFAVGSDKLAGSAEEKRLQARARVTFPVLELPSISAGTDTRHLRGDSYLLRSHMEHLALELYQLDKPKTRLIVPALSLLLTAALLAGAVHMLKFVDRQRGDPPVYAQEHFYNPPMTNMLARVDLGREGELSVEDSRFSLPSGYSLNIDGFYVRPKIVQRNPLAVTHYLTADHTGYVRLNFPKTSKLQAVSLFVWGANKFSRGSRVISDQFDEIVLADNKGAWLEIPLTDEEQDLGRKEIKLVSLTSGGLAVSAVVLNGVDDPEL